MEEPFKEAAADAAIDAANQAKRDVIDEAANRGAQLQFHEMDHTTYGYIRGRSFEASEATLARMTGDVKMNLAESYEQGLGIDEAAERLKDSFQNMRGYELERVARTEINGSQNAMRHREMDMQGIAFEQWWGADDDRTRTPDNSGHDADHSAGPPGMHGQIVRTGDEFSNGLKYPGDKGGPIEEWINCRCRVVPFIMPEGYGPPPGKQFFYESELVKLDEDTGEFEQGEVSLDDLDDVQTLMDSEQLGEDFITKEGEFDYLNAGALKDEVVNEIYNELKDNPAFRAFAEREFAGGLHGVGTYPTDAYKTAINNQVKLWAQTSGDNNTQAIAMQMAFDAEFKTGMKGMQHITRETMKAATGYFNQNGDALRAIARAQYNVTQKHLAQEGIREIVLYRGMRISDDAFIQMMGMSPSDPRYQGVAAKVSKVQLQPASSFSASPDTAIGFAGGTHIGDHSLMMVGKVPAKNIIGTPRSGFGCLTESEFVVMGGKPQSWATIVGHPSTLREAADNVVDIAQTIADMTAAAPKAAGEPYVIWPDGDLANADWTKTAWDFPDIESADDLLAWIEAQGMTVAEFKALPVYQFNKDKIAWLKEI